MVHRDDRVVAGLVDFSKPVNSSRYNVRNTMDRPSFSQLVGSVRGR